MEEGCMIKIGDIVKHYKLQSRVGIVIAIIDKQTIVVDWFNKEGAGFMSYRYHPYALVKVSQ
jgi:hypothetical protein